MKNPPRRHGVTAEDLTDLVSCGLCGVPLCTLRFSLLASWTAEPDENYRRERSEMQRDKDATRSPRV